jgi:glutamate synthase (NADPH/NADH) small chain
MSFQKPAIDMPKQNPEERINNFEEVALGYTKELALEEASRCLNCKNPQCVKGCPVNIDIPAFINLIKEEKYIESARKIKEYNALPAICGRVCPQENQCQRYCIVGIRGAPIEIGRLERFVADYEIKKGVETPNPSKPTEHKIAIVGAGPAGLTAAAELKKYGHEVEIFEALHVAGGVLMYGIPEFRLPKEIVQEEVDYIKKLGVKIHLDSMVGKLYTVQELFDDGFESIFIGSGAGLPRFLNLPGENLSGIYSANEFLIRTNLMKAYRFPVYDTPIKIGKSVAVIGGGNVAMDAARCSLRLGAENIYVIYRRGMTELPARNEEIENAEEEGCIFTLLNNPTKFIGDGKGNVKEIELIRMRLGEPDDSGRRRPVPIPKSEWKLPIDTVVIAIGQSPNPIIQQTTEGLETTRWGTIITDEETMLSSINGVYAGGDVVSGAATVISAMGAGKRAAKAINDYLEKNPNKIKST